MKKVVIVGAGLTGISAAFHFEQIGFDDYILFEKESEPGGLCRSITQDGFTFDYTGHLLHINDDYFKSLIEQYVGFDQFHTIHRRSYIYSQNTYTDYPFQINLHGLPKKTIIDCIMGYVERPSIEQPKNFKEWVDTNFGTGFGNYFFYPYQEKIFSTPIKQITASWTNRFVPSTSLEQILEGTFANEKKEGVGYNAQFYYPKQGGIFSWVKQFAHQIRKPIQTDFCVDTIDIKNKTISFTNGHTQEYETLITTMPLDILLGCIKEPADSSLATARANLRCNKVVNFNLGIDRPALSDKHWIYFPEEQFPFYRIGFSHNFAASMAPPNCSSLYGEFSYIDKSPEWISTALAHSIQKTKQLFGITSHEIITEAMIHINHAYVIFDAWRDSNLPRLLTQLEKYGIHSVGRYGAWKYASMQEGILDGKEVVEKVMPAIAPLPFKNKKVEREL